MDINSNAVLLLIMAAASLLTLRLFRPGRD